MRFRIFQFLQLQELLQNKFDPNVLYNLFTMMQNMQLQLSYQRYVVNKIVVREIGVRRHIKPIVCKVEIKVIGKLSRI